MCYSGFIIEILWGCFILYLCHISQCTMHKSNIIYHSFTFINLKYNFLLDIVLDMVCCFTDNFMRIFFFFCTVVPNGKNLANFIFCTVVPICRKMAKMFFFTSFKQNLSVYTDYPPTHRDI